MIFTCPYCLAVFSKLGLNLFPPSLLVSLLYIHHMLQLSQLQAYHVDYTLAAQTETRQDLNSFPFFLMLCVIDLIRFVNSW